MQKTEKKQISYIRIVFGGLIAMAFMLAMVFVLAGRTDYWQGWVFSIVCTVMVSIQSYIMRKYPDLAQERAKPGPGVKWWDRIFYVLFVPSVIAIMVVGALDSGRYGWSGDLPVYFVIKGNVLFIMSVSIFLWAMLTNRWFSSMVRIQKDREQQVVKDGPYKTVRHPGYVGGILMSVAMAMALGSIYALIPAALAIILLVIRTSLEDKTLQKELPGYVDYAKMTKYRLIPGIW